MKKLLLLLLLVSFHLNIIAQNDIQFSNYMFSEITYNPAQAGNSQTIDATIIARQQWIGFGQSPQTQLLSVGGYFEKISGGVGLSFVNDKLGYEKSQNIKLMYAYQLSMGNIGRLSFGLGFGLINRALEGAELVYDDMTDQSGIYTNKNKMKPDFDFGIAFNSEKYTIGLSTTHLEQSLKNSSVLKAPRHYYFIAKYKYAATNKINIIPSLKIKSSQFITQFDISALMYYGGKFWAGASYRYKESIVGLIGVDITQNIRIGYSYDYNSGAIKSYSSGSHEILLLGSFNLQKSSIPSKSPRFFN